MPNELSGGMRKRAGFARALVLDPDIVLFDEPDSGLDPVRTALLCELIQEVHAENGGAYAVITHDIMSARRVADYIAVLWKGRIVESGPASELFNSAEPVRAAVPLRRGPRPAGNGISGSSPIPAVQAPKVWLRAIRASYVEFPLSTGAARRTYLDTRSREAPVPRPELTRELQTGRSTARSRCFFARLARLAGLIAAVVLVALLMFGGRSDYRVTAVFENAGQLVKGNQVRVGGRPVGAITEIELTTRRRPRWR